MRFEFATATRIIFGAGTLREVGPLAAEMGSRALVVTGRTPERAARLLDALAMQLPYADLPLVPVLYSRKDELYAAQFVMNKDHHLEKTMDYISLKTHTLASVFTESCIFIGNDFYRQSSLLKDVMGEAVRLAPSILWQIKAGTIGAMALQRFRANDFDVIDIGQNVAPQEFVKMAIEEKANIIGASAFMSSTRSAQKKIIKELKKFCPQCRAHSPHKRKDTKKGS